MTDDERNAKIEELKARIKAATEKLGRRTVGVDSPEVKDVVKRVERMMKTVGDTKNTSLVGVGAIAKEEFDYLKVVTSAAEGRKIVGVFAVLVSEALPEDFENGVLKEMPAPGEEATVFRVGLALRGAMDAHELAKMVKEDIYPKLIGLRDSIHAAEGGCEGCATGHGGLTKPISRDGKPAEAPMGSWPGGKIPVC